MIISRLIIFFYCTLPVSSVCKKAEEKYLFAAVNIFLIFKSPVSIQSLNSFPTGAENICQDKKNRDPVLSPGLLTGCGGHSNFSGLVTIRFICHSCGASVINRRRTGKMGIRPCRGHETREKAIKSSVLNLKNSPLSQEEVIDFCGGKLATCKLPKGRKFGTNCQGVPWQDTVSPELTSEFQERFLCG